MAAQIRHIEAFLAVARVRSFTRAAADLHVSQPALTVQIRQLESALGVRLFDRNNRRVALTHLGRELVAPFERVLLDLDAIAGSARDFVAHRRGVVTVACLPSVAAERLPRAIALLTERHDGITVRVRDGVAARVVELVRKGEADVGITGWGRADAEIAEVPLFVDRLAAFVAADHRLASRPSATLRDVAHYPLILTGRDSSVRELVERALDRGHLPRRVAQEVTYMPTALGLAAAGLGVTILPEAAIATAPAGIRAVSIERPVLRRRIGVITRAGRSLTPAAERLLEALRTVARFDPRSGV